MAGRPVETIRPLLFRRAESPTVASLLIWRPGADVQRKRVVGADVPSMKVEDTFSTAVMLAVVFYHRGAVAPVRVLI